MLDTTQKQIADEIKRYSNGDDRLGELLSYCIGRLCLKSAKAGNDWRKELNSIDVPHIVDWLKAAIISDDAWLKNVDEKNRPKKLMKFGSFEDIQKEADKAMRRANQRNFSVKIVEGDEEFFLGLEDDYYLVELLTPAALDREGATMQHCIGGGAYDEFLNSNEHYFLSLRDHAGKPHATLEICNGKILQLQGKQNKEPVFKYIEKLKTFFSAFDIQLSDENFGFGFVITSDGSVCEPHNLPDSVTINGNLSLQSSAIKYLPKNLTVKGNLDLSSSDVKLLPNGLKVGGGLNLSGTKVKSLPNDVEIGGDLDLIYSDIDFLPENLHVKGNLHIEIEDGSLKDLPKGLKVDGYLSIGGFYIRSLPDNLEVGGNMSIAGTQIEEIPRNLKVGGDLTLKNTEIDSLPNDMEVGGRIWHIAPMASSYG